MVNRALISVVPVLFCGQTDHTGLLSAWAASAWASNARPPAYPRRPRFSFSP